MEEKDQRQSAFITALTTEHYVLQTSINASASDAANRASLYIFSLSSALVAMGFASRSQEIFVPFIATVLPALFLLGVFTVLRLVDAAIEQVQFLYGIAHIRGYYRTLSPEAAEYFAAERGRWPETQDPPALRLGVFVAFVTTNASMVAFINSVLAGVGVTMLVGHLLPGDQTVLALVLGVAAAVVLMVVFLVYQRYRIAESSPGN
jgi:hypothetical protein